MLWEPRSEHLSVEARQAAGGCWSSPASSLLAPMRAPLAGMEMPGPTDRAACRKPGLGAPPRGVTAGAGVSPLPAVSGRNYCNSHPAVLLAFAHIRQSKMLFVFLKLKKKACQVHKTLKPTNTQALSPNFFREHQQVPAETMLTLLSWAASSPEEEVTVLS